MKEKHLLFRLLVRLLKKNQVYDKINHSLCKEQIINELERFNQKENSIYAIKTTPFDYFLHNIDILKVKQIQKELNKLLFYILYEKIKEFFIQKNIYHLFINNIKQYNNNNISTFNEYYYLRLNDNTDIRNFIILAFSFYKTKEKTDFWVTTHNQYVIYVNNLLK